MIAKLVAIPLLAALVAVSPALAQTKVPGVTDTEVVIGITTPLSGPAAAWGTTGLAAEAWAKHVNDQGGVHGRKLRIVMKDDGYVPGRAVANVTDMKDSAFAIVGLLGSAVMNASKDIVAEAKIPTIYPFGDPQIWAKLPKDKQRYVFAVYTNYVDEGEFIVQQAAKIANAKKIAIFYQNDDYGKDYLRGIKAGLGAAGRARIVSERGYEVTDASYASQIVAQRQSGADTWVLFTTAGTPTVRALATAARIGWKPDQIVINGVAATDQVMAAAAQQTGAAFLNGTASTGYLKNPTNPKYRNDSAIRTYRRIMANYGPDDINIRNTFYYTGIACASDFVKLLYAAGKNLTRESLRRAYEKMNWVNPYMLQGSRVKTGRNDHFPIDQAKIVRYNNGTYSEEGRLLDGRR